MPFSGTEANVPEFEELSISPIESSGNTSKTVSLPTDFDEITFIFDQQFTESTFDDKVRVNGVSTNDYKRFELDGTETEHADGWRLLGGVGTYRSLTLVNSKDTFKLGATPIGSQNTLVTGLLFNVSPPANQITFISINDNLPFDIRARAFGLEV